MKVKDAPSSPAVGGSSLLVIFGVLCLTVFALLCLSTAQMQRRLSDAGARAVSDYYAADCGAEEIFARLRSGQAVAGVEEKDGKYTFLCPISENQNLMAELLEQDGIWRVLRWQAVAEPGEEQEYNLPVWAGPKS